jgi:hypothetical protein
VLERLILRCLAKDPDARPASAQDVHESLERAGIDDWSQEAAREWWETRHLTVAEDLSLAPPSPTEATLLETVVTGGRT